MNDVAPSTIGRRLWLLFGAMWLVLAAIGALSVVSLRTVERRVTTVQDRALRRLEAIDAVGRNVGLAQAGLHRRAAGTPADAAQADTPSPDALDAENERMLVRYEALVEDEAQRRLLTEVSAAREAYRARTKELSDTGWTGAPTEATRALASRQWRAFEAYTERASAMVVTSERTVRDLGAETGRIVARMRRLVNLLVGGAICLAVGIAFAVARIIRRLHADRRRLITEMSERQRSEATLRESEEKFRQFAEHVPDVFWMTSPDLQTIRYVNPAYEAIWGRTIEGLYADSHQWSDAVLPEDRARVLSSFGNLVDGPRRVSVDFRIVRPDGSVRWIEDHGFQIRDASGSLIAHAGIATDVTERRRVANELERRQAESRALFDLLPAMVWFKDTHNRILRVNKAVATAAGLPVEELEGRPSAEVYPDDAARYHADDLEVMRSGVPKLAFVETLRSRTGDVLWVQTDKVPYRDRDGTVVGIVVMSKDVTATRRAEEDLRLLGSAVEQSQESILITDAELDPPGPRIRFVNPAFTRMTGYAPEDVIGRTPRILQGPLTDRRVLERLRQDLAGGGMFQGEAINYRKDGTEFIIEWQIAPILDADGHRTHFVAIQRDITGRRRLEAQLLQSQRLETVGKLAGGVAHEFNSILTAIMGQSELLLGELPSDSPLSKGAAEIRTAAERAAVLTRQLLAYGRKQVLQPRTLDLNSLLAGMEVMLRHLMGPRVDVRVLPGPGLRSCSADAGQIEQVIVNIAMNAIDAMPNGGNLTMETANVTLDREFVARSPELVSGDYLLLAITDTGVGMTEEVRARVFEPFFSTKPVGQGTGLGLSTCYGIVKQSGGHISVYSEVGRGTTFKVYLPQIHGPVLSPARPMDSPGLPRGTETILLVEDDLALSDFAATLLRRLGYLVFVAANGIEALSLKQRSEVGHVDLLFTDVVMPHMSGKELSERVRALSPHTRILFTSAYTENAISHQGVLAEGVDLLQKPFTPSTLARRVRELLDRPRA